jgi:hypothetical protein
MALVNLKSRFDRHTIQDATAPYISTTAVPSSELKGNTVSNGPEGGPMGQGPNPSHGFYYRGGITAESDSPFDSVRGLKMDQMVALLNTIVTSKNHAYPGGPFGSGTGNMTYNPSPINPTDFQDLNGGYGSPNPTLGQFGGPYSNPETGTTYGG